MKAQVLSLRSSIVCLVLLVIFCASIPKAHATVFTPGKHQTGWLNQTYVFDDFFSGYAVFGVSDEGNTNANAKLLLDNIQGSQGVSFFSVGSNLGFEEGNLNNYNPSSGAASVVSSASFNDAYVNNIYVGTITVNPTEGTKMALLDSYGSSTSGFTNASGESGTDGSFLFFEVDASAAGDTITFDWNFFSDESPGELNNNDFAFFRLVDRFDPGDIFTTTPIHSEVLAQVGVSPVPLPAAVWLMGSGLIGLMGFRKKK